MKTSILSFVLNGVALVGALAPPTGRAMAQDANQEAASRDLSGEWAAERDGTTLTIRLRREQDVWTGWFVSRKTGALYPLKDVVVHDRSVAFTFASDPVLSFNLALGNDGATLDGDAELPDGLVLPYTFKRTSSR